MIRSSTIADDGVLIRTIDWGCFIYFKFIYSENICIIIMRKLAENTLHAHEKYMLNISLFSPILPLHCSVSFFFYQREQVPSPVKDTSSVNNVTATVNLEDLSSSVRSQILNLIGDDIGLDTSTAMPSLCLSGLSGLSGISDGDQSSPLSRTNRSAKDRINEKDLSAITKKKTRKDRMPDTTVDDESLNSNNSRYSGLTGNRIYSDKGYSERVSQTISDVAANKNYETTASHDVPVSTNPSVANKTLSSLPPSIFLRDESDNSRTTDNHSLSQPLTSKSVKDKFPTILDYTTCSTHSIPFASSSAVHTNSLTTTSITNTLSSTSESRYRSKTSQPLTNYARVGRIDLDREYPDFISRPKSPLLIKPDVSSMKSDVQVVSDHEDQELSTYKPTNECSIEPKQQLHEFNTTSEDILSSLTNVANRPKSPHIPSPTDAPFPSVLPQSSSPSGNVLSRLSSRPESPSMSSAITQLNPILKTTIPVNSTTRRKENLEFSKSLLARSKSPILTTTHQSHSSVSGGGGEESNPAETSLLAPDTSMPPAPTLESSIASVLTRSDGQSRDAVADLMSMSVTDSNHSGKYLCK